MLAVTSHDFRDLESEVEEVRKYLIKARKKYPKVKFYFTDTAEAFRRVLGYSNNKQSKLKLKIKRLNKNSFKFYALKGKIFGPQPFLAIKFKNGRYMYDNLDFGLNPNEWFYTLRNDTVLLKDIDILAIGASDKKGNFDICKYQFQ